MYSATVTRYFLARSGSPCTGGTRYLIPGARYTGWPVDKLPVVLQRTGKKLRKNKSNVIQKTNARRCGDDIIGTHR